MGLTSEHFTGDGGLRRATARSSPEVTRSQLEELVAWLRHASPPTPLAFDRMARDGKRIFTRVGCGQCHVPLPLSAPWLAAPTSPYTDLTPHDVGAALADGIHEGRASETQFRTAPLWGLRLVTGGYLHDGRAATVDDAIRAHAGEAAAIAANYRVLSAADRAALLAFLRRL